MSSRPTRLSPIQAARKLALLGVVVLLLAAFAVVTTPLDGTLMHEWVEALGRVLLAVCILGRCWCTLYIGGRKISQLVRVGPYSMMRNPLYTMSFIGAAGVGAQTGSLVMAALAFIVAWIVFRIVVSKEESFLAGIYGEDYAEYLRTVPRFFPNPFKWKDVETLEVRPDRVVLTFIDGLWFLAAIPLAEGFEALQNMGLVPVLLRLP